MKRSPQTRLSLRARLVLWQLVVVAPLLLTAMRHQRYPRPRFTEPLQKIAEDIANEVLRIKSLRLTRHAAGATASTRLYI
jgi:hypothetical protein